MNTMTPTPRPATKDREKDNAFFKSWLEGQARKDDEGASPTRESPHLDDPNDAAVEHSALTVTPREYQNELFERAKTKNTIVVLETGSGKTLIAIMLLRHVVEQELENRAQGQIPKTAFFVVDKVALCMQQYLVVRANLPFPVTKFHGDMQPIQQDQSYWDSQFDQNMIVVCTAQILLDFLNNGFIRMDQINLLIFDEAHHSKGSHPYARIMKQHYARHLEIKPRILGLTASPVDTREHDLQHEAEKLESIMCSEIATVSDDALAATWLKRDQAERIQFYSSLKAPEQSHTHLSRQIEEYVQQVPQLRRYLLQALELGSTLGDWCADRLWRVLLTDSRRKSISVQSGREDKMDFSYDQFEATSQSLDALRPLVNSYEFTALPTDQDAISSKLSTLREILFATFEQNPDTKCIVFVQTQFTAIVLAEFFHQPDVAPAGMIADFMVGLRKATSVTNYSQRDRIMRLESFRHGETNCLFATSVAEEGLDIPACDLVIRFDICTSAIQYIQSRGRARKETSVYITMLEADSIVQYRHHQKVVQDAKILRRFCQSLPGDRKIESYKRPPEKELVVEGTATLSKHNSMAILAKFVACLAEGTNTSPVADYMVSAAGSNYLCWVILPDAAPFKSTTGSLERSKIRARSAAAYEACVTLIEMGYINKNLQPTFKKKLPRMRNARLALSSGTQKEYNMLVKPSLWTSLPTNPPTKLFQTYIELHQNENIVTPLIILTRTTLPDVGSIRLFITEGENTVAKLVPVGPIQVSEELLRQLSSFTLKLFDEIFSKEFDAKAEELPFYFAPSFLAVCGDGTKRMIDWALLKHVTATRTENLDTNEQRFVIDPHNGSRRFIIQEVNPTLRATDPTPAEAPEHKSRGYQVAEKNIMQYSCSTWTRLRSKFNFDPDQPVYNALLLSLRRNFLIEQETDVAEYDRPCHITLQFLRVSSIPPSIARSALLLPSILHRLESALIVREACNLLELNIPAELALEAFTKSGVDADDDAEILENERNGVQRNYERLEFIGDTFLKMSTTIALYTRNSYATEYELHVERMLLVCNKNLFNTALELDVPSYVRSGNFDRRTWYPNLPLIHGKAGKASGRQNLADKTVADVCEALVGAAYMTSTSRGNMDEAVKAVTKFVNNDNHTMTSFSDYYASFSAPSWHSTVASAGVKATVDRMADAIGYRFQSPLLLRSALTHPSYKAEDIPNYQTLEFLGDALLDMAVVDYLFRKYPNAGPQWLTEHKMAVCGNQFLSCLCIDLDIQREILSTEAQVPGHVSSFEARLRYLKDNAEEEAAKTGRLVTKSYWTLATKAPKLLADVIEALIGAMFVDSHYDYAVVHTFFQRFIQPYFEDMSIYEAFGPGHAITQTVHQLQNHHRCSKWRFCVSEVPCETKFGIKALTECDCICALMIHGEVQWHAKGESGMEAKSKVATTALGELQSMGREQYREKMACDCDGGGASQDQHVSEAV